MDNKSWPVTQYIGSRGYLTVVNNTDSEDWKRPASGRSSSGPRPQHGKGAIILMHDSGGDRSQTVTALGGKFLPKMQKRGGYSFANLTDALGAPSAHSPVTGFDLWKGKAFVYAVGVSEHITDVMVAGLAVIGGVLVFARFGLMLVLSFVHARRVRGRGFRWGEPVTRTVTSWCPRTTRRSASRTRCVRCWQVTIRSKSS